MLESKKKKAEEILQKAVRVGDCLIHQGSTNSRGYGNVYFDGISTTAHSIVCELIHGPRPTDKHCVLHSCDNKKCIEPRHLRWGTQKENVHDWIDRRTSYPPGRPRTFELWECLIFMKLNEKGLSMSAIGRALGFQPYQISRAIAFARRESDASK